MGAKKKTAKAGGQKKNPVIKTPKITKAKQMGATKKTKASGQKKLPV